MASWASLALSITYRDVWRESFIVFVMVVFTAYAAALILNLITTRPRLDQMGGTAGLAAGLLLLVIALGVVLRRSTNGDPVS